MYIASHVDLKREHRTHCCIPRSAWISDCIYRCTCTPATTEKAGTVFNMSVCQQTKIDDHVSS